MYEDFATKQRAEKGMEYVAEEFGNDFEFRQSTWRLDILQDSNLNALAVPALAEADLLIISLRGERELPIKIHALIEGQLAQTVNHECALMGLFESVPIATGSSVYASLANLARQHGLDFFEEGIRQAEDIEGPSLQLVWVV
jgi:hypothetical protein